MELHCFIATFYRARRSIGLRSESLRKPRHAAPPKPIPCPSRLGHCSLCRRLDYLSTLAYQPSIAYQAAGLLAPLATVVVVLVTLFAALPVYLYVAGRSPHGGGAVALLERLVPGWRGKFLILILLGFTATDFVFTRTFSAAAAAEHLIHNPQPAWQDALDRVARACGEYGTTIDHPLADWLRHH